MGVGKLLAFWTLTLSLPLLVAAGAAELLLRALEGPRNLVADSRPEASLDRSEQLEVHVVTEPSLKGMVRRSRDPELVYELKPDHSWTFLGAEVRTNSLGLRERELPAAPTPGSLRVVGIGDSILWGWGVSVEQGCFDRIAAGLDRDVGRRVEAFNLAVPTYNTLQEAALFKRVGASLRPDVVVLAFTLNDGAPPAFGMRLQPPPAWQHSALLSLVHEGLGQSAGAELGISDEGWLRVAAGFAKLRAETRAIGADVLMFVFPQKVDGVAPVMPQRLARAYGFHYVDLYPPFDRYYAEHGLQGLQGLGLAHDDGHPIPEGHRLIAEVVRPALVHLLRDRLAKRGG